MVVGVGDGFDETHVSSFAVSKLWNLMIIYIFLLQGSLTCGQITGPCFFLLGSDTTWKQFMDLAFLVAFYSDSD